MSLRQNRGVATWELLRRQVTTPHAERSLTVSGAADWAGRLRTGASPIGDARDD